MSEPKRRPLSKREEAWIRRLQKTLDACPTKRLGFFTIGDPDVSIYDNRFDQHLDAFSDSDFCTAVDRLDVRLGEIVFPDAVQSTAG